MRSPFFFFSQTTQNIDSLRLEIQNLKNSVRDLGSPSVLSPFTVSSLKKEELAVLCKEVGNLLSYSDPFDSYKRLSARFWLSSDSPATLRALLDCFLRNASRRHFEDCAFVWPILNTRRDLAAYIRLICEHELYSSAVAIIANRIAQAATTQDTIAILYSAGKLLADCYTVDQIPPSFSFGDDDDDDDFDNECAEAEEKPSEDLDILELEQRLQSSETTQNSNKKRPA